MTDNSRNSERWRKAEIEKRTKDRQMLDTAKDYIQGNTKRVYLVHLKSGGYVDTTNPERWESFEDDRIKQLRAKYYGAAPYRFKH